MVNLLSLDIVQLDAFLEEIREFPLQTREDVFSLVYRFLKGERLHSKDFKIFKIDKNTKIMEFKVKDDRGNWRAISTMINKKSLVFVYAFHKKTQELAEKDKELIRRRIKRISL